MTEHKKTAVMEVENQEEALLLFGRQDEYLRYIRKEMDLEVSHQSGKVTFTGEKARDVAQMMERLLKQLRRGDSVGLQDIKYALMTLRDEGPSGLEKRFEIKVSNGSGRIIKPMSPSQRKYFEAMNEKDMVFAVGPAGTGKTYLAVAMAVRKLMDDAVKRIIICRPAVEAGEKLGFLPGDFQQKVDPYLRPIYDALFSMLKVDKFARLLERGIIEVAPLAFMRGRTLDDAFVIMDEAQNTTVPQMKMFLTRLGRNSCAVVTGDNTQTDLPRDVTSGLSDAIRRFKDIEEIKFIYFSKADVVRHDLVAKIIEAYEGDGAEGKERKEKL